MAKLTMTMTGINTGKALTSIFSDNAYRNLKEWSYEFDNKHHQQEIEQVLLAVAKYGVTVETEIVDADGDINRVEYVPLKDYEHAGGEYSDAGNGGEDVEKADFDYAARILEGFDKFSLYGNFWEDTVTGYYLHYKN